jgi:hypothetical protein
MSRTIVRPSIDQLVDDAHKAIGALQAFIDSVMPHVDDKHGISLDTADPLVAEVEAFVTAYKALYGSPIR